MSAEKQLPGTMSSGDKYEVYKQVCSDAVCNEKRKEYAVFIFDSVDLAGPRGRKSTEIGD